MKLLKPNESELVGNWIIRDGKVYPDKNCKRIEWLVSEVLHKIGFSKNYGAWETLYYDPNDQRFWIMTYPNSDMHGGGPPKLEVINKNEAKKMFNFDETLY